MMETGAVGFGLAEFLLLLFGGQFLGLVPGERDAQLIKSPPAQAYFYQEWTAMGSGQTGAPGIEGFVIDPEIEAFAAALKKSFTALDSELLDGESDVPLEVSRELPTLLLLAARHSGAIYLANSAPDRDESLLPVLEAALILNLGDDADEFVASLNRVLNQIPGFQPTAKPDKVLIPLPIKPLMLHQAGERLIVTTGPAAWERLRQRWEQPEPELAKLPAFQLAWKQSPVQKFGGLTWFNAASLRNDLQQEFGLPGAVISNVARSLGLSDVESSLTTTGLEQHDQVSRTSIALTGDRGGLLKLFSGRALSAADFTHIPADADFVAAASLNLGTVRDIVRDIVAKTLPDAVGSVDEFQRQLEQELQLKLDDVVTGFGDVWTVHDSPANGGMILAGLVAGVPVRDQATAQRVVSRLQELLIESLPRESGEGEGQLEELQFQGTTIYYLNWTAYGYDEFSQSGASPAFCLTDSHLWFALHPQAIKAQLRFLETKEPRFDPAVKFPTAHGTGALLTAVYLDTPSIGRIVYPLIPYLAKTSMTAWQQQGTAIDLGSVPSARAVLPYLRESTFSLVRGKDNVVAEQRNVFPVMLSLTVLPHLTMGFNQMMDHGDMMLLEGQNRNPAGAPAVNLGAAEGDVVQAKSETPAEAEPSALETAARRTLPFLLKSTIPDEVEVFIPQVVFEKLAEPADPEKAAERAAERQRRRDERAARRAARKASPR